MAREAAWIVAERLTPTVGRATLHGQPTPVRWHSAHGRPIPLGQ
jgi:hypothetical protein